MRLCVCACVYVCDRIVAPDLYTTMIKIVKMDYKTAASMSCQLLFLCQLYAVVVDDVLALCCCCVS